MYYKPDTNQLFTTHSEIRSALTYVLFPESIDEEMLAYHGVFPVKDIKPSVEGNQVAHPSAVEEIDGTWTMIYEILEASEEEIEAAKPPVPAKVTRRQARSALLIRGLLEQVDIVIAAIPDVATRKLAQIEWQDASEFDRNRTLVIQIGTALGLDSKGLDDLFRLAVTL